MSGKRPVRRGKAAAAAAAAAEEPAAELPVLAMPAAPELKQPIPEPLAPEATPVLINAGQGSSSFDQPHTQHDVDEMLNALNGAPADCSDDLAMQGSRPSTVQRLRRAMASAVSRAAGLLRSLLPLLLLAALLGCGFAVHRASNATGRRITQLQDQVRATGSRLSSLEMSMPKLNSLSSAVQGLAGMAGQVQELQQWHQQADGSLDAITQQLQQLSTQLAATQAQVQALTEQFSAAAAAAASSSSSSSPFSQAAAGSEVSIASAAAAPAAPTAELWQDEGFAAAALQTIKRGLQPLQPSPHLATSVAAHSELAAGLPLAVKAYRLIWGILKQPQQPVVHPMADDVLLRAPVVRPGRCLPLAAPGASSGGSYVDIKLDDPRRPVTAVSLHLPPDLVDISSAPRSIELLSFNASGRINASGAGSVGSASADVGEQESKRHLGTFALEPSAGQQQYTFHVDKPDAAQFLRLRVLANHGNQQYTCLYRLGLHAAASAAA